MAFHVRLPETARKPKGREEYHETSMSLEYVLFFFANITQSRMTWLQNFSLLWIVHHRYVKCKKDYNLWKAFFGYEMTVCYSPNSVVPSIVSPSFDGHLSSNTLRGDLLATLRSQLRNITFENMTIVDKPNKVNLLATNHTLFFCPFRLFSFWGIKVSQVSKSLRAPSRPSSPYTSASQSCPMSLYMKVPY